MDTGQGVKPHLTQAQDPDLQPYEQWWWRLSVQRSANQGWNKTATETGSKNMTNVVPTIFFAWL